MPWPWLCVGRGAWARVLVVLVCVVGVCGRWRALGGARGRWLGVGWLLGVLCWWVYLYWGVVL